MDRWIDGYRYRAISEAAEAAAAKLGTTGPHCAAHHHLSTAHASLGAVRGLAEPAAANEISARPLGVLAFLVDQLASFLVDQLASNRRNSLSPRVRHGVRHGGNCSLIGDCRYTHRRVCILHVKQIQTRSIFVKYALTHTRERVHGGIVVCPSLSESAMGAIVV